MIPKRLFLLLAVCASCGPVAVYGQADAQDRTQQFFDTHKSADVVNPDRALNDKVYPARTTESQVATLPPLTGVDRQTSTRIKNLLKQENEFVDGQIKRLRAKAPLTAEQSTEEANKARAKWRQGPEGRELTRLEREAKKRGGAPLPDLTTH